MAARPAWHDCRLRLDPPPPLSRRSAVAIPPNAHARREDMLLGSADDFLSLSSLVVSSEMGVLIGGVGGDCFLYCYYFSESPAVRSTPFPPSLPLLFDGTQAATPPPLQPRVKSHHTMS